MGNMMAEMVLHFINGQQRGKASVRLGVRTSSAGASWMSHEMTSFMTSVPAWSSDAARPRCATAHAEETSQIRKAVVQYRMVLASSLPPLHEVQAAVSTLCRRLRTISTCFMVPRLQDF